MIMTGDITPPTNTVLPVLFLQTKANQTHHLLEPLMKWGPW